MIDVMLPSNVSEILSKETKKNVIVEKVVVHEGHDGDVLVYRYRFTLSVDNTPTTIIIEANVESLFNDGTNITDFLLSKAAKKINEKAGGDAKSRIYDI